VNSVFSEQFLLVNISNILQPNKIYHNFYLKPLKSNVLVNIFNI
jgi:hypothetical protein